MVKQPKSLSINQIKIYQRVSFWFSTLHPNNHFIILQNNQDRSLYPLKVPVDLEVSHIHPILKIENKKKDKLEYKGSSRNRSQNQKLRVRVSSLQLILNDWQRKI